MKSKILLWGLAVVALTGVLIAGKFKQLALPETTDIKTYNSMSELRGSVRFKFNIPEMLSNETNLTYTNKYNQFIEIGNSEVTFEAGTFVNNKADLDGEYNEKTTDKEYKVDGNTKIKYMRIRTDSDNLDNMKEVKVNYNTGDIAYSLQINRDTSYKDIINDLGLDGNEVKEIETEKKVEATTIKEDNNYDVYTLNTLGYSISIPKCLSVINTVSGAEKFKYETFIMSGKSILTIEESNNSDNTINSISEIKLGNGYVLKYYTTNPFDNNTQEYKSYENILSSINYIAKSFKKIDK